MENKHYLENFENRAKSTLTADGLQERYIDRRVKGYDDIDREKLLFSKDINAGLVDTYGLFDLTELFYDRDNYDGKLLEEETGVKIYECIRNFDFISVLEIMAETSLNWLKDKAKEVGKPFEARLVSIYAPSEYNYTTDDYEMEVVKNPFKTTEELADFLKSLVLDEKGFIVDEYRYEMEEAIDMAVLDWTTSTTINGKDYKTLDEFRKSLKK